MIKKTLNFDKFMSEKDREQIKITFKGHDYLIYSEIPAIIPIMMARVQSNNTNDGRFQQMIFKAVDTLFGAEAVDQMCADGATANELIALLQEVFAIINGKDEDESEEYTDEDSRKAVKGSEKK